MRYTEILTEKKRKRRARKAPKVAYGYWWGLAGDQSGSLESGDGGGDGGGGV